MLRSIRSFKNLIIRATDGEIGNVEDLLFDDDKWTVRYLVVNTGSWLSGRKVLVSPISIQGVDASENVIQVSLTQDQVRQSPEIDTDKPVSRQIEVQFSDHYRWPSYWGGPGIWGLGGYPSAMLGRPYLLTGLPEQSPPESIEKGDPHLRSARVVQGYRIQATDKIFGHIEDFVLDEHSWTIRYLVIDTINFWPSKSVIISPDWVNSISWDKKILSVNLSEESIKNSAEFHPNIPINREYEEKLYDYYGRPKYWDQSSPGIKSKSGETEQRILSESTPSFEVPQMTPALLNLTLTHEDVGVLKRALAIRLENLRFELARTDSRDYRVDLRHQLDRLESIERELKALHQEQKSA